MCDQFCPMIFSEKTEEKLLNLFKDYKDYFPLNKRVKSYNTFLGVPLKDIVLLHEDYHFYKYPDFERAVRTLLKDWKIVDERRFDNNGEEFIPRYLSVEVERGIFESVLEDGSRYYENPYDHKRLVIRAGLSENPEGIKLFGCVWFIMCKENEAFLKKLVREIGNWIIKNHHLRGKKVKPDGSLLRLAKEYSFDDIVLDQGIKEEIDENVIDFFRNREDYIRNGLPRKRGIILYGVPGVGKTLLGKVLCSQLDCTFIWVTPSKMSEPVLVAQLFEMARDLSPTIVFMEDLDFYASNRSEYGGGNVRILGEILNQMDGFEENGDVVVIATTNDIGSIEPALKDRPSRFDRILELKPPDLSGRKKLLKRLLPNQDGGDETLEKVAQRIDGFNGAQIQELVILAKKEALRFGDVNDHGIVEVKMSHFEAAVDKMRKKKEMIMGFKND